MLDQPTAAVPAMNEEVNNEPDNPKDESPIATPCKPSRPPPAIAMMGTIFPLGSVYRTGLFSAMTYGVRLAGWVSKPGNGSSLINRP